MTEENNQEIERDVEVMEIALCPEEIDELIAKLELLKESKESISFDIDEENELMIHYDDLEDEE